MSILMDEIRQARKTRDGYLIRALFAAGICRQQATESERAHLRRMTRLLMEAGEIYDALLTRLIEPGWMPPPKG